MKTKIEHFDTKFEISLRKSNKKFLSSLFEAIFLHKTRKGMNIANWN